MKINNGDIQTQVAPGVNELVFRVDEEDQGFIFEMLRSKIYSDAIGAICREISANARDANREVGKGEVPVVIGIGKEDPLDGNSSLHVFFKDEGPGISPDRMVNVFCKYAKSTKRDTDDLTGGFGLGAKTPFAYVDAFTIITNVDGVRYMYSAYIDESKRGKIAKLSEESTTEPNGTTIMVPIQRGDRQEFERGILKYTLLWKVRPNYVDISISEEYVQSILGMAPEYEFILKSGIKISIVNVNRTSLCFDTSHAMLVDGMPYAMDPRQVDGYSSTSGRSEFTGMRIVAHVNTGTVDLAVNRETLQYTDATKTIVRTIIDELADVFIGKAQEIVSSASSYFEACVVAHCLIGGKELALITGSSQYKIARASREWLQVYASAKLSDSFTYDNKPVKPSNDTIGRGVRFQLVYLTDSGNVGYKDVGFNLRMFYSRPVYVLDTPTKSIARSTSILAGIDRSKYAMEFLLVSEVNFQAHKNWDAATVKHESERFEKSKAAAIAAWKSYCVPTIQYSSVPLPAKGKPQKGARAKADEYVNLSVKYVKRFGMYSTIGRIIDGCNVRVKRGSGPVDTDNSGLQHLSMYLVTSSVTSVPELSTTYRCVALIMHAYYGMKFYIVPKRYAAHFRDCLDIETAAANIDSAILDKIYRAAEIIRLAKEIHESGIDRLDMSNKDISDQIRYVVRAAGMFKKRRPIFTIMESDIDFETAFKYVKHTPAYNVNKEFAALTEFQENIYEIYPLLRHIGNMRYTSNIEAIRQYVRLMDEENERKRKEARRAEKAAKAAAQRMPVVTGMPDGSTEENANQLKTAI